MEKKKVALISFHNAYNYGACLQAYALQEAVTQMNTECEYINYINPCRAEIYDMKKRIQKAWKKKDVKELFKNVCGIPFARKRAKKFDAFYEQYLKKTDTVCHNVEEAQILESQYDKFISGSDQIWNAEHNGTDGAYFLEFVKDSKKKISYSSSFGMAEIPEEMEKWYADLLNGISCLSTREKHGVKIIQKLTGRKAHLVLDPVFLLDSHDWKKFVHENNTTEQYTFYYMNARFNLNDFSLVTGYEDKQKHILSSSVRPKDFLKRSQKVTFAMSPQEFIQQIYDAELVVTTSFHCLAFSILLHKPFVAILSGDEGRDERLLNLLQITGLESRIFSDNMTLADVQKPIDYENVEMRLAPYRKYSRKFLYTSIHEGQAEADYLTEPPYPKSEKNAYEICPPDKCTGCGACAIKCPRNAITMTADKEGFLQPIVNQEKCVHCNLCRRVCQINDTAPTPEIQHYYAFKNTEEIRKRSSSGGAFSLIAQNMLRQGGKVVASQIDENNWTVAHTFAENEEEVRNQAKTYYVQGSAFQTFAQIEKRLKDGEKILFTGTPCQVGGLKKYLNKDYENLLLCDIICHGIPSPKMFAIYTDYLKSRGSLTSLRQRDKRIAWQGYSVSAEIDKKTYKNSGWLKAYSVMFSHALINRKSCFSCMYSNYNRAGDITIGDYWGIEKHHRALKDRLGVSLVITNSEKGEKFFKASLQGTEVVEVRKSETAQNSLTKPKQEPLRRRSCIKAMEQSYEKAAKQYGEWNLKGYVKECIRTVMLKLK